MSSGAGYSMGVPQSGDFDNDGWSDLYVTGVNRNILYRNQRRRKIHGYHGRRPV